MDRKLYRELGCSSINQYAEVELGFSKSRTNDFIMLCRKLKNLPLMKDKLESGDLGYTKARVLTPVVDNTNEEGWLDYAVNNTRRDWEREVKRSKKEAADKAAGQPTLIAVPKKRPAAVVPTSKGELEISKAELEAAQCDCQISRPGERNTTSIPPAVRRRALADNRHKCQRPGCGHTHYLHVHHIVPRSQGARMIRKISSACV